MTRTEASWFLANIELIKAFSENKIIQWRLRTSARSWVDTTNPVWNPLNEYRVKPEPKKVYIYSFKLKNAGEKKLYSCSNEDRCLIEKFHQETKNQGAAFTYVSEIKEVVFDE